MKRALPGTKSKKATPASKPAAKRPAARRKSKPAKPKKSVAEKIAPTKRPNAKIRAAKPKTTKPKLIRKKAASSKTTKIMPPRPVKRKTTQRVVTRNRIIPPPPTVAVAEWITESPRPSAKPKVSRKIVRKAKPLKSLLAKEEAAVPFAIEDPAARTPTATALPTATARPKIARKIVRKSARKTVHPPPFTVPDFLLEGDGPSLALSGPGEKFSLGPTPPLDHFDEAKAPLPESYGTGRLFLTARDPHWLYAHWDFTMQEQFRYNAQSVDRHMVLRLHHADQPSRQISEVHVHPESRHWFTHVDDAGQKYFAEIGYYVTGRRWKSLATSDAQRTPPDNISADSTIQFATIPLELSFETMLALLQEHTGDAAPDLPLAQGIEQIRAQARHHFPRAASAPDWTPEQEQALAEILAAHRAGAALPGSEEFIPEKLWPEFSFDAEADAATAAATPTSYVSSFFGGGGPPDFWFNVNAELIVYGATDPQASLTFAGKKIPLHPDGSFRFHFALPDGQYELPISAVSADGTDSRAVELKFTRATEIRGDVTAASIDPALKAPPGERA